MESKPAWPGSLTTYLKIELRAHLSEAWISGHQPLIAQIANDEKDRHVLAAAVHTAFA